MIKRKYLLQKDKESAFIKLFGSEYLFLNRAFKLQLEYLSSTQRVKQWEYVLLDNDGFYMHPSNADFLDLKIKHFHELVSSETAGIIACLNVYKNLSQVAKFQKHFETLKEFSSGLPDKKLIARAIGDFTSMYEGGNFSRQTLFAQEM